MVTASSGWACAASSSSGTGVLVCGRPYRSKSWAFQVISPVSRFSSKPPMRPSRWACWRRLASRAVSSSMRQMSRTALPCRLTLMSATADSGTWSTSAVRLRCRARNGSPVAYTRSTLWNSSLSPAAIG